MSDLSLDRVSGTTMTTKKETNRESGQLQLVMHHLKSVVIHYDVIHRVSMKSS